MAVLLIVSNFGFSVYAQEEEVSDEETILTEEESVVLETQADGIVHVIMHGEGALFSNGTEILEFDMPAGNTISQQCSYEDYRPERENYWLNGWFDAKQGGNKIDVYDTPIETDIELYASWTMLYAEYDQGIYIYTDNEEWLDLASTNNPSTEIEHGVRVGESPFVSNTTGQHIIERNDGYLFVSEKNLINSGMVSHSASDAVIRMQGWEYSAYCDIESVYLEGAKDFPLDVSVYLDENNDLIIDSADKDYLKALTDPSVLGSDDRITSLGGRVYVVDSVTASADAMRKKPGNFGVLTNTDSSASIVYDESQKIIRISAETLSGMAKGSYTVYLYASGYMRTNQEIFYSPEMVEITFDPANGEGTFSYSVMEGGKVRKPSDPEREGYAFMGWYKDNGRLFDFDEMITGAMTLTAGWKVPEFEYGKNEIRYEDGVSQEEAQIVSNSTADFSACADSLITEEICRLLDFYKDEFGENIRIKVTTSLSLVVQELKKDEQGSISDLTIDITPKYQVEMLNESGTMSMILNRDEVIPDSSESIPVKIYIPEELASKNVLWVTHKTKVLGNREVKKDDKGYYIEFVNRDGFSPFKLSVDQPAISATDGTAYGVIDDYGNLILFRSFDEYEASGTNHGNYTQTVRDIYGNQYTGYISTGVETLIYDGSSENVPWSYAGNLSSFKIAENQIIQPLSTGGWFAMAFDLNSVDLTGLDTSKTKTMADMFMNCTSLTSLDISMLDTSAVENMSMMFSGCTSLTQLDLSSFDVGNVRDLSEMFGNAENLQTIDLSSWKTDSLECTYKMFFNCSSLTYLDLSGFNMAKVSDMRRMFGCENLRSINLGEGFTKWNANSGLRDTTWVNKELGLTLSTSDLIDQYPANAAAWAGLWTQIPLVDLKEAYLSLKDDLGVHFKFYAPDEIMNDETVFMQLTTGGLVYETMIKDTEEYDSLGDHVVSVSIPARKAEDDILVKVVRRSDSGDVPVTMYVDGKDVTEGYRYSASDYINAIKEDPYSYEEALVSLISATEDFINASRIYFGYNDEGISLSDDVANVVTEDLKPQSFVKEGSITGIRHMYANLSLKSKTEILQIFKVTDPDANFIFYIDGEETMPEVHGDTYTLRLKGIIARDLDRKHRFAVKNADTDEIYAIDYSALSYAYQVLNGNQPDKLKDLARALYLYNQKANTYFDQQPSNS